MAFGLSCHQTRSLIWCYNFRVNNTYAAVCILFVKHLNFRAQNDLYIPNLIGLQKCNIEILWLYLGLKEEENLILIHA